MNPWGIVIIGVGILMIYIGIKGSPSKVAQSIANAYGNVK